MRRIGAPAALGALVASLISSAAPIAVSGQTAVQAPPRVVVSACLKASTLANARTAGETTRYDDRVGHTALLMTGWRGQPPDGARGYELCLYNERTGTASVVDADGLIEAP